jgi:uncharacterized protein (TIGR02596 family)
MEQRLAMMRFDSPDPARRFRPFHPASWRHAFTLVEMLVVMAIIAILVAIAMPATSSFLEGNNLDSAAHQVADQINLAHQFSSSLNVTVELRLFKLSGAPTAGYTALQLGTYNSSGTWTPVSRPSYLPPQLVISPSATVSTALSAPEFSTVRTMGANNGLLSSATYVFFDFRPSGVVTPVLNAVAATNMSNYALVVLPARYASVTTLGTVKNYAIVQINPVTATPLVYRP